MENKIKQIIEKVRQMYKYIDEYKSLLSAEASIHLSEKSGEIILENITFNYYDRLIIADDCIVYVPEHGQSKKLIAYNGWDELLTL